MAVLGLELTVFMEGRRESPGAHFEMTDFLKQPLPWAEKKGKIKQPWKREGWAWESQVPACLAQHPTATAQPGDELGHIGAHATDLQVDPCPVRFGIWEELSSGLALL